MEKKKMQSEKATFKQLVRTGKENKAVLRSLWTNTCIDSSIVEGEYSILRDCIQDYMRKSRKEIKTILEDYKKTEVLVM